MESFDIICRNTGCNVEKVAVDIMKTQYMTRNDE